MSRPSSKPTWPSSSGGATVRSASVLRLSARFDPIALPPPGRAARASVVARLRCTATAVGACRSTARALTQVGSSKASRNSGKPRSTSRWMRWQTLACSVTRVMAKRAASRSSAPARGSRGVG